MDSMTTNAAVTADPRCGTAPSWARAAARPIPPVLLPFLAAEGSGAASIGAAGLVAAGNPSTAHRKPHASVRRSDDL